MTSLLSKRIKKTSSTSPKTSEKGLRKDSQALARVSGVVSLEYSLNLMRELKTMGSVDFSKGSAKEQLGL